MDSLPQFLSESGAEIAGAPGPSRTPDERQRQFLRVASHELRTPLNAIIGFAEIIATELYGPISEPRYREHAALIHQSGLKLMKLVSQVMDIARLETGAMELAVLPESVAEAFTATLRGLHVDATGAQVTFATEVAPGAETVCADGRAMVVALNSLVENAIIASPPSGVVRLSAQVDGAGVRLTVRDDGPGIPEAEIDRLIRPFVQGEDALVRRRSGAGLGLTLTRLLCAAMGGDLRLTSSPGCGVTASIHLPAPASTAA